VFPPPFAPGTASGFFPLAAETKARVMEMRVSAATEL
jgi:hypothetical protein